MKLLINSSIIIALNLLFSFNLYAAECANIWNFQGTDYCIEIHWQTAVFKRNSQTAVPPEMSPYLNPMSSRPNKWMVSAAVIIITDIVSDTKVEIPNLSFVPYMLMDMGHSHPAYVDISFDTLNLNYVLSEMNFQEMSNGCWELRIFVGEEQELSFPIFNFANLSDSENMTLQMTCDICRTEPSPEQPPMDHSHMNH